MRCNQQQTESISTQESVNGSEAISNEQSKRLTRRSHSTAGFPFVEGHPFTATLWNGIEGFHMTVNGRHETSYRYREVRFKGFITWYHTVMSYSNYLWMFHTSATLYR